MSDALDAQLAFLRNQRDNTTDQESRAMYEQLIAEKEAQRQLVAPSQQIIGGHAHIGVAVAGSMTGNIYLDGRRADQAAQLLRDYLQLVVVRCGSLPLQALYQQAGHDERSTIGLADVYTQLAVYALVEREVLDPPQDAEFDAEAYLRAHVGPQLLPIDQRDGIWLEDESEASISRMARRYGVSHPLGTGAELARMDANELRRIIGLWAARISFTGPQLLSEAVAAHPRLVLLGEPGSGKSTALRFLALTLAEAALDPGIILADQLAGWQQFGDQGRLLPLFLPLLSFARMLAANEKLQGSADLLWSHIADQLEPGGARKGLAEALHSELCAGQVLVLFDGLDEVVGAKSRQQIVQAVAQFAREYPHCRVVVSCRVRAYEGQQNQAWQLPGWPSKTLQPWGAAQQQSFIAAWYLAAAKAGSLPKRQSEQRIHTLQRAIAASPDLQRLAANPLLLTVMALVHLNDGRLPEDRVALYGRCVDILLAQWEQRGKDASDYGPLMEYIGLPDREIKLLLPLLTQVAYTAHLAATSEHPGSLDAKELRAMTMDYLAQIGHDNPYQGAQKLLEYTDHRAGMLQASDAGNTYVFPHLTFQEYLAGLHLASGLDVVRRIIEHHISDDRWRVPIFLGVGDYVSSGKLEMPYQLLNELISDPDAASIRAQRDTLFACELATDLGWQRLEQGGNSFRKLRRDMAVRLALVVEGTTLPAAERAHAGVLLAALGDLRPGVCTHTDLPFVRFAVADYQIGLTQPEYQQWIADQGAQIQDRAQDALQGAPAHLAAFELARYLVTNAQWALFMQAGGYQAKQSWWEAEGRAWLKRTRSAEPGSWQDQQFGIARPNHPVVGICWYEATAFCRWLTEHLNDGYIYCLPSELEWEYACRGQQRRMYAWGDELPDGERANMDGLYDGTSAVGSFASGATPTTRLLDMIGNVWEWTRSEYRAYPYDPEDGREHAPQSVDIYMALRGGGWNNRPSDLHGATRSFNGTEARNNDVGMRLARRLRSS